MAVGSRATGDLARFVAERFPLPVCVPLGALLYLAPASLRPAPPGAAEAVTGALSTLLALLCLRACDDLADRGRDRALHPERGLASGRIDAGRLARACTLLAAAMALLDLPYPVRLAASLGAGACYLLYVVGRERLHPLLRPFASNLVFPLAVLHGSAPAAGGRPLLLALFAWLAAVGHEFAHNALPPDPEGRSGPYARILGARGTATLGILLFAAAAGSAGLLWQALARPALFGAALAIASAGLAIPAAALLCEPGPRPARRLHAGGILFALLPALALLAR